MTAQADLFAPWPAAQLTVSRGGASRILHTAAPLPERSGDDVAWVRSMLEEYQAAHDSERRARHYALKRTTARHEQGDQTELYQKHLVRQERVVMALVEAVKRARG